MKRVTLSGPPSACLAFPLSLTQQTRRTVPPLVVLVIFDEILFKCINLISKAGLEFFPRVTLKELGLDRASPDGKVVRRV